MKCPLCSPFRYPDWPELRQAGIQDYLKCPVSKALFYPDGREIKEEEKEGKSPKGFKKQEKLIRDFIKDVSKKKTLSRK